MFSVLKRIVVGCGVVVLSLQAANSATLRVAPTSAELIAPDSATTFSLRNEADRPLNAQIRVFRWVQQNGKEQLVPTNDLVASPPMAALRPNTDYTIRVVRVKKGPAPIEESYRVVIDELPDPRLKRSGTVNLVVRHVIPVFFRNRDTTPPSVNWTIQNTKAGARLVATNQGGTHLRLSDVKVTQGGKTIFSQKGLMGYVLGNTTMGWAVPLKRGGSGLKISGMSTAGQFTANVASGR